MSLGAISREAAERIDKRRCEGRGEGESTGYQPWLNVRSCHSHGNSHRLTNKHGRQCHFFSNREYRCALILDWADTTADLREQFPLHPLEETIEIAGRLGVRHPAHQKEGGGQHLVTMTTDILVTTTEVLGLPKLVAISAKPAEQLAGKPRDVDRLLDKAEIERTYWARRDVPFRLVTDHEMPKALWENLHLVMPVLTLDGLDIDAEPTEVITYLFEKLAGSPTIPLRHVCQAVDRELRLTKGSGLSLCWHAIATRRWRVDMMIPIDPDHPLHAEWS